MRLLKKVLLPALTAAALGGALLLPASPGAVSAQASTWGCTTSALSGNCGPYAYPPITQSNGYTTYDSNNMWGCGSIQPPAKGADCGVQTVQANSPGDWQVTSDQAAGNTAVLTYPDVQQVFTNGEDVDPPLTNFGQIVSGFTENMNSTPGSIAEAGYDIWTDNYPSDIMVWVDNANRGTGGATVLKHMTLSGKRFTLLRNGGKGSELILSMNSNEQTGVVHILTIMNWLVKEGYLPKGDPIGQIDFGWEICSTGGVPQTFQITNYYLHSTPQAS